MKQITPSPWHLARQHAYAVARSVKQIGIREVARRAKVGHMVVSRFVHDPTAKSVTDFYQIANAVGFVIDLKLVTKS
jgi:hypothetical protein